MSAASDAARSNTVLVVDDEPAILDYLSQVLEMEGYDCRCFEDSKTALAYLSESQADADLMLTDINMPEVDGLQLLRTVKDVRPELPIILVSGLYELAIALEALESGADDYLKKPVRPADVITAVTKYLHGNSDEQEAAVREALGEYVAAQGADPRTSEHIAAVFNQLGFRRYETFQHSKRVAAYCRLLGEQCGLAGEALDHLEVGALLHDIGKIGIPRNVLLKPGPLTDEEWTVMRSHPSIGHRLMARFEELTQESDIVHAHHERFDGEGYPQGLAGEAIPLGARLFSIVDTLDAITSDRPYRKGASFQTAREEIRKMSGSQFDPKIVESFLAIPTDKLDAVRRKYPDKPPNPETLAFQA